MKKDIYRAKLRNGEGWVYWNHYGQLTTDSGKRHSFKKETSHGCSMFYSIEQMLGDIISTSVGRYTGLTDKNGTKIFEGDILEAHFDEFFPDSATRVSVAWHGAGFVVKQNDTMWDALLPEDREEWEVIGNIYDNPDLLQEV